MIALSFPNIEELQRMHSEAIEDYVRQSIPEPDRRKLYTCISKLPGFEQYDPNDEHYSSDYAWLRRFILADILTLRDWATNHADKLRFGYFKDLYLNRFAKGADHFVDTGRSYNAYTLFDAMNIRVCPYCEHEYLAHVRVEERDRRTMQFDHFYPKDDALYPGLAMCFYNLIPCCSSCNTLKLTQAIAANPYDADIETLTSLHPDIMPGVNIETLSNDDCAIDFHASGSMVVNERVLALEQRYDVLKPEVRDLLRKKQQFSEEKLEELERMGLFSKEQLKRDLFGAPRAEAKGQELHTKMKHDLISY